jgi:uncharacterized protein YqeY
VADSDLTSEESPLKARLAGEMREAMKSRQTVRLGALRLLAASVKNREVELRRALSDDEFVEVVTREVKRRREAIESYELAGRQDRVAQEREEQEVLEAYLPARMSEAEVGSLIDEAIGATGARGPEDMGKVMGFVMGRAKGRVDGKAVQEKVHGRLSS